MVPSWAEKGTQLDAFRLPKYQALSDDEIKKVPSWTEKGTQLLHKKLRYYLLILFLSVEAIKLKELMELLDYKNEKTFKDNYLKPLRELNFIELTSPDSPTNPGNQYRTTQAGISFISGMANSI